MKMKYYLCVHIWNDDGVIMFNNIIKSYDEIDEENRLKETLSRRVEFISTVEALEHIIKPGMDMLDCGCGCGIYSFFYAKKGVNVTALDIVPKHVKRVKEINEELNYNVSVKLGNAIDLSQYDDMTFDVTLCLGPIYHLVNEKDQSMCLKECKRVTKTNGIIAISYISPFAVFPYVVRGNKKWMSDILIKKILDDKKIESTDKECFWTDNKYYTPAEILKIVKDLKLDIVDHLTTDGQSIAFQSMINELSDDEFEIWMNYHRKICRNISVIECSNHGLIICRKKESCENL